MKGPRIAQPFRLFFCYLFVVRFFVVEVDVQPDADDDQQDADILYEVVVNPSREIAEDEEESTDDCGDDTIVEFLVY